MKQFSLLKKVVGLQYSPDFVAPRIIFKSQGKIAERVLILAKNYKIPMKVNEHLSEILYSLPEGSWIPENQFLLVAQILTEIYNLKGASDE